MKLSMSNYGEAFKRIKNKMFAFSAGNYDKHFLLHGLLDNYGTPNLRGLAFSDYKEFEEKLDALILPTAAHNPTTEEPLSLVKENQPILTERVRSIVAEMIAHEIGVTGAKVTFTVELL